MKRHHLSPDELSLALKSVTDYAIFTQDTGGRVTTWNEGAERMFGYSEPDILGHSIEVLFTPEDRAAGAHVEEMRQAAETGRGADDREHVRKDGSRFFASGVLSPVRDESGQLTGYVKVCRDLTDRRQWERSLMEARESLEMRVAERTVQLARELSERQSAEHRARAVLNRLIATQEEERRRIARDLHDHLGQQITALHLQLETLKRELHAQRSPSLDGLNKFQTLFQQLDKDLDFFTWELRPGALYNLGLIPALTDFTSAFSQNYGLPVTFERLGVHDHDLPKDVEVNLYRIAQEALNNTYKHAQANRADVLLQRSDGRVILTISDDGKGFSAEDLENRQGVDRGMGLGGMQERAALLGGALEIESRPNQGTSVVAIIPISQKL